MSISLQGIASDGQADLVTQLLPKASLLIASREGEVTKAAMAQQQSAFSVWVSPCRLGTLWFVGMVGVCGLVGRYVVHWWLRWVGRLMWVGGLMWVGRLLGGSRCVAWGLGLHYLTTLSLRPFVLRRPVCAVWRPSGDNADSVASGGAAVLERRLGHHITTSMRRSAVLANAAAGKVTQAEAALQLLSPTAQMGACCV